MDSIIKKQLANTTKFLYKYMTNFKLTIFDHETS